MKNIISVIIVIVLWEHRYQVLSAIQEATSSLMVVL
jgi:hypothetical protein